MEQLYDLAIVGGGINGCGIARDAAGRGLKVFLCEQNDLASGTSSASTKLIHGGLRYLEYYAFRLVREALHEREVLLRAAPHIIWPLRFILPYHKGLRPSWLIRLGLFLYDHLGGRVLLPGTTSINLQADEAGAPLKHDYTKGFEYSDCWVIDSRLVILNAMAAAEHGATIRTRCRCLGANRTAENWTLQLQDQVNGQQNEVRARVLINATGPWLEDLLEHLSHEETKEGLRMVKGSHIIIPKLFDHDRAYIFQNDDGRIVFAIPYEHEYTLIGTTDVDFSGDPGTVRIDRQEIDYLCKAANEYFTRQVRPDEIVHTYSGIRPLFDDGCSDAKAATRDYILQLDTGDNLAPLLSIYGGKITTYRKLAESVLEKLKDYLPAGSRSRWTEHAGLPGGSFKPSEFDQLVARLHREFSFLDRRLCHRLTRTYGTCAFALLDGIKGPAELGSCFGADLYEIEVRYLIRHEWARTAEDILWRRTNLGLACTPAQSARLTDWLEQHLKTILTMCNHAGH